MIYTYTWSRRLKTTYNDKISKWLIIYIHVGVQHIVILFWFSEVLFVGMHLFVSWRLRIDIYWQCAAKKPTKKTSVLSKFTLCICSLKYQLKKDIAACYMLNVLKI